MTIRVAVVDDQQLVREGLVALLETVSTIIVVGTASDGEQARVLVERLRPDVVLMDLRMPRFDGITATRQLAGLAHIIALTTYGDDGAIRAALAAGARGYLTKDVGIEAIAAAIEVVAAGGTRFDACSVAKTDLLLEPLTPREREILKLIMRGARNDEIGRHCGIAKATVKTHVRAVLSKFGARDRADVVRRALGAGLVD